MYTQRYTYLWAHRNTYINIYTCTQRHVDCFLGLGGGRGSSLPSISPPHTPAKAHPGPTPGRRTTGQGLDEAPVWRVGPAVRQPWAGMRSRAWASDKDTCEPGPKVSSDPDSWKPSWILQESIWNHRAKAGQSGGWDLTQSRLALSSHGRGHIPEATSPRDTWSPYFAKGRTVTSAHTASWGGPPHPLQNVQWTQLLQLSHWPASPVTLSHPPGRMEGRNLCVCVFVCVCVCVHMHWGSKGWNERLQPSQENILETPLCPLPHYCPQKSQPVPSILSLIFQDPVGAGPVLGCLWGFPDFP